MSSSRGSPPYELRKDSGSSGAPGSVIERPSRSAAAIAMTSPSRCRSFMQLIPQPPSAGTNAAFNTIWVTRPARAATTPGTTRPPEECATSVIAPLGTPDSISAANRRNFLVDRERGEIGGPVGPSRQVHRHRVWVEVGHQSIPIARGYTAAMDEHHGHLCVPRPVNDMGAEITAAPHQDAPEMGLVGKWGRRQTDSTMRTIEIDVDTAGSQCVDLTKELDAFCAGTGDGLVNVLVPHATAGLALMETGSGSEEDLVDALGHIFPRDNRYRHADTIPGPRGRPSVTRDLESIGHSARH